MEAPPRKKARGYRRLPLQKPHHFATEVIQRAHSCYNSLSIAGADFERATVNLCGEDGNDLRAVLVGGQEGDHVTVKQLWLEKASDDPVCKHLSFVDNPSGTDGQIVPRIMNTSSLLRNPTPVLQNMIDDFRQALCSFSAFDHCRFDMKGQVNKGVVMALNGVDMKSLEFLPQTGGISKSTDDQLHSMIKHCIAQSSLLDNKTDRLSRYRCVSQQMATIARNCVIGCDLRRYALGFGNRLPGLCRTAITKLEWPITEEDKKWVPRVDVHSVQGVNVKPFEVSVVHDFAPPSFVSEVRKQMNNLYYLQGTGGKTQAKMRCASLYDNPAPFTTGNIVYAGVPASAIERKLLDIANTLCSGQRSFVETKLGGTSYLVTFAANQALTVVATFNEALFKKHSDFSERLCSREGERRYEVSDGLSLPLRTELQVITFVFSNSPLSDHSTDLVYYQEQEVNTTSDCILGKIPLSNCCLHMQGAGSQALGVKHAAVPVRGATNGMGTDGLDTIWRVSVTCRCTLDPFVHNDTFKTQLLHEIGYHMQETEWKSDYVHNHVFDQMACDTVGAMGVLPNTITTPGSSLATINRQTKSYKSGSYVNLMSRANSDTFPRISKQDFDKMPTFKSVQSLQFLGQMSDLLSTHVMTKYLFDHRILVQIKEQDLPPVPIIHHTFNESVNQKTVIKSFPIVGQDYKLSHITTKAGLIHTSRASCPFDDDPAHSKMVVLSKSYKNHRQSFRAYIERLSEWRLDRSKPFFTDGFRGDLIMYGSGGSPQKAGNVATDYAKQSKAEAAVQIPESQNFNSKFNAGLRRLSEKQQVLAVYVREDVMYPQEDGRTTGTTGKEQTLDPFCTFWGFFSCVNYSNGPDKLDDLERELTDAKIPELEKSLHRFCTVPHVKLFLEPLFSNEQIHESLKEDYCNYTMLTVDRQDGDRKMSANFPLGDTSRVMSIGPNAITHADLGRLFLENEYEEVFVATTAVTDNLLDDDTDDEHDLDGEDEEEEEADDDETEVAPLQVQLVKSSATNKEALHCALYVNYAGACRWLGSSLNNDTYPSCKPIDDWRLPVGLANHAHPMSSRLLDVNTLFYLQVARQSDLFERSNTPIIGHRVAYEDKWMRSYLEGVLFQSVVMRFTGRVKHYRTYSRLTGAPTMVPLPQELEVFLNFMEHTAPTTKRGKQSIGRWLSNQHKSCIPFSTRSFSGFSKFTKSFVDNLHALVEKMMATTTRTAAINVS